MTVAYQRGNGRTELETTKPEELQPWITCHLTEILLSYIKELNPGKDPIDYAELFKGIEGFELPADPETFLTDASHWAPLSVLRDLELYGEKISGRKDFAYQAARAYFKPGRKDFPSLVEIIFKVLNDVRSTLIFCNLWGAAQTNYIKLQSFEKSGPKPELYLLAQFDPAGRPALGSIYILRGFVEGFPRLYPFIDEAHCIEEISQLRIADILREFPEFTLTTKGDRLIISHGSSKQSTVEAVKVELKSEKITLSPEFTQASPDAMVLVPTEGQIEVLTHQVDAHPQAKTGSALAYQIIHPGELSYGSLTYAFKQGQIYNAPYCRFRFYWQGVSIPQREDPTENVRKEVSRLLFNHLEQMKQTHLRMLQQNIEKRKLTQENIRLRREIEREFSFAGMIGQSRTIQELFDVVRSISETDVTVLIQGETGTGKEMIAKAIHYNSPRKAKRFVAINCGALSETLLESELFGHEKGAFTGAITQRKGVFEVADGGTLFLDEIGEISPNTQVRLLRVLQDGEFQRVGGSATLKVDLRVIAATNQDLDALVKDGRFRQDLYYRLHVFPIKVPPLRERADDIPLLVSHFIEKRKKNVNKQISGISPQATAALIAYSWPGNVRELENVIQRMMVVCKGEVLDLQDIPTEIRGTEDKHSDGATGLKGISQESEKRAVIDALSQAGGNVTRAAKSLGISRATLQNKMKLFKLKSKD